MNSNNPNKNTNPNKRKFQQTNQQQQSGNQSQQHSGNKRPKHNDVPLRRRDPTIDPQRSDTQLTQIAPRDPTRGHELPPFRLVLNTDRRTQSRNQRRNQNPQSDDQQNQNLRSHEIVFPPMVQNPRSGNRQTNQNQQQSGNRQTNQNQQQSRNQRRNQNPQSDNQQRNQTLQSRNQERNQNLLHEMDNRIDTLMRMQEAVIDGNGSNSSDSSLSSHSDRTVWTSGGYSFIPAPRAGTPQLSSNDSAARSNNSTDDSSTSSFSNASPPQYSDEASFTSSPSSELDTVDGAVP